MSYETIRIGKRIAELRKAQGMSQAVLAEKCGMKQQNIARIENGQISAGIDTLARIADALGTRLDL